MTGDEIRGHLRAHMIASWYQEDERRTQIDGAPVTIYWPGSIPELRLYSPDADWTEGIVSGESYTALCFPDDYVRLFVKPPDQW